MAVDPTKSLMPAWMPHVNRKVINPVQRLWARYLPPYAIVVHSGRRSGKTYSTPVWAFRRGPLLAIVLPYGSQAQWVKNLISADGGDIIRAGKRSKLQNPRIVTSDTTEPLPRITRPIARRVPILACDLG